MISTGDTTTPIGDDVALLRPEQSELIFYQTEDGLTRVQIRLYEGTVWMTQAQLAELYQVGVPTVNEHIHNLFAEGEVLPEATIRKFRTLRTEGNRSVSRTLEHYSLPVVVAVGYRVRSPRGTQFRRWATTRLEEYIVKGFALDELRLKHPAGAAGGPDYFEELLARIRDIRSSEKVFYRKVLAIFATSVDYDPRSEDCAHFFATVQNKMHWAAHGHTAAEVIAERADASKPHMGLTSFAGPRPRKADISVAKNYLLDEEIDTMNRIVSAYLEFADLQASHRRPMHMADWAKKLDDFLALGDRAVLDAGHSSAISHDEATEKAAKELVAYTAAQAQLATSIDAHFDEAVQQTNAIATERAIKP